MQDDSTGTHYASHQLYWDSGSQDFEAYYNSNAYNDHSPSGMEIALNFYGYDKEKTYLCDGCEKAYVFADGPYSESQDDKGSYWNSDMPYAYIDTTAADNEDEPGAGLGSGYWLLADYDTWYFAWTDLTGATTDADDYKVLVQRTHRHDYSTTPQGSCSNIYTNPWCYYTDGTSSEAVESWAGNAPETQRSWNYPGQYPFVDPSNNGYTSH